MPDLEVIFYCDDEQRGIVREQLADLRRTNQRAFAKCYARIDLLRERGHTLRHPHADFLRDGIWELRIEDSNVNYRILYFFFTGTVEDKEQVERLVVLSQFLTKEAEVPAADIERAIERKKQYEANPQKHTFGR